MHEEAYQMNNFKLEVEKKKLDLPVQKNLLTNYFCILRLLYLVVPCASNNTILSYMYWNSSTIILQPSLFLFHLTYEGFASLEAKRKFRLPRNSPKQAFTDFTTKANSCKGDNSTTRLESVSILAIISTSFHITFRALFNFLYNICVCFRWITEILLWLQNPCYWNAMVSLDL